MHEDGTPNSKNNPLLFWVALLLQTEEFGKQPRLNFADLQDSLIMREKLLGIVHYARALILDYAFATFCTQETKEHYAAAAADLNGAKYKGSNVDVTDVPHWNAFIKHFEAIQKKWLSKGSDTPIGIILTLL